MVDKLSDRFYATFADGTVAQADSIEAPEGRVDINAWVNLKFCFGAIDLPVQEVYCE